MGWRELGSWPGKLVVSQEVGLAGTFENISSAILQVRKLRLGYRNARRRLTRPVSSIPALTHPSFCLSSEPAPEPAVLALSSTDC